jgi:hypothetical protein
MRPQRRSGAKRRGDSSQTPGTGRGGQSQCDPGGVSGRNAPGAQSRREPQRRPEKPAEAGRGSGTRRCRTASSPLFRIWGPSSKWAENRVKPGRGSQFFLPYRIFPPFNNLQPILVQRPIWRDVLVERLPGNSQFAT